MPWAPTFVDALGCHQIVLGGGGVVLELLEQLLLVLGALRALLLLLSLLSLPRERWEEWCLDILWPGECPGPLHFASPQRGW